MRTVAVLGATGVVGREICRMLSERRFPMDEVRLLASARSAGTSLEVLGRQVVVEDVATAEPAGIDVALFSAGRMASRTYAPAFVEAGAFVVDNSSAFRQEVGVPLVVPEVNSGAMEDGGPQIIANPNCSTIILMMPLYPLHRRFGVRRVIVSTYQAVSGAGRAALQELENQIRAYAAGEREPVELYDRPLHLNLIPQIGADADGGFCEEEHKMVVETHKILGAPEIRMIPTTIRVPVRRCHSESVYVELDRPATREEVVAAWAEMPNLTVIDADDHRRWPTPRELAGSCETWVGRLRPDPYRPDALAFWVVADQLLKGAALNAVQIAERLVADGRC